MSVETIRELSPLPDGATTVFETPTPYKAGTLRLIINGVSYEDHDDIYGWTELNPLAIQINEAPLTGALIQAFYTDIDASEAETLFAVGSPYAPGEGCP
jgi:hypothetical protein